MSVYLNVEFLFSKISQGYNKGLRSWFRAQEMSPRVHAQYLTYKTVEAELLYQNVS